MASLFPPPTRTLSRGLVLVAAPLFLPAGPALAQEHLMRRLGSEQGLPGPVWSVAQDTAGFLWMGTAGGLYRYDGVEMRRWAPDRIGRAVVYTAASAAGVLAIEEEGDAFLVEDGSATRLAYPRGDRVPAMGHPFLEASGVAWIPVVEGLERLDMASGEWRLTPLSEFGNADRVRSVRGADGAAVSRGRDGGVLVAAGDGVWWVEARAPPRLVARMEEAVQDVVADPRALLLLGTAGTVLEVQGEREVVRLTPGSVDGRPLSLARRGETIWVSFDRYLAALRGHGPEAPRVLGPGEGIEGGGRLLVDREESLWVPTWTGLFQLPEPATSVWREGQGFPSSHTRFLARSGDRILVVTWQGSAWIEGKGDGPWIVGEADPDVTGRVCEDEKGTLWTGTDDGLTALAPGGRVHVQAGPARSLGFCAPSSDGGRWVPSMDTLFHLDSSRFRPVPGLPGGMQNNALVSTAGDLWVAVEERICRTPESNVLTYLAGGVPPSWSCEALPPGTVHLTRLVEVEDGVLWGSSSRTGILAREVGPDGPAWTPVNGTELLPTRSVPNLVRSLKGGVWVLAHGATIRVIPPPSSDRTARWRVVESLGSWNGVPLPGGTLDLLEEADGTLWLATERGVVRVAPEARRGPEEAPRIVLSEVRVDGRRVEADGEPLRLPHSRNRLELRFAALTYRDPHRVRYRARLAPGSPWEEIGNTAGFRWVDLPPGRYQAEVTASLDGWNWSADPALVAFQVLPAWYRTGWFGLALVLVVALAGAAVYRARVGFLLELERQRTRIAMDLHDELGSGLGSIGILAELAAREAIDPQAKGRLAKNIAATAGELGHSLSDIIWALDPRADTLLELGTRLTEHAARLFPGTETQLVSEMPGSWPSAPLSSGIRRGVLMVGLEALHNAARHSRASRVHLRLRPGDRGAWILEVEDDGVGMATSPDGAGRGRGRGRRTMETRAAAIGGRLEVTTREGTGTRVQLVFPLE